MGNLDEAIREHLELKRQHGAEETELRKLEDEAFGPPARPGDPEFEATAPDADADAVAAVTEAPTEFLAEPEAPPPEEPESGAEGEPSAGEVAETVVAESPEPAETVQAEAPVAEELDQAEGEASPASDEIAGAEPEDAAAALAGHRDAIADAPDSSLADQPTEFFDFDGEISAETAASEDLEDEADPFDERSLSEELDQALESPAEPASTPEDDAAPGVDEPQTDERPIEEAPPAEDDETGTGEDVLEETPDFLEDTPDHDRLWFEQKPPKDFDFDE